MADLSSGMIDLIGGKLREQAQAHVSIAAILEARSRALDPARAATVLLRAHAHAEIARGYQLLAGAVGDGFLVCLMSADTPALLAVAR